MSAEQQEIYTLAGITYISAFFPKDEYGEGYTDLYADLKIDPVAQQQLETMHTNLVDELLAPKRIKTLLSDNPNVVADLFAQFRKIAVGEVAPYYDDEIAKRIDSACAEAGPRQILKMFLVFNEALRMTNMFKTQGQLSACSFRLDPSIVLRGRPKTQYPETPYGIYLVRSRTMSGFHTRMRDVARGGLRMVLSRNTEVREKNARTLFDEGYNLALTQQRKNKDIPEGGSKGVMLPEVGADRRTTFVQYLEAMLDCMQPEQYGIYSGHLQGRPENLYFGPDENTADFMDLGAEIAKSRGYKQWKAITTGKSVKLGGIPHDTHGMTTAGVHRCVLELLSVLNENESNITKVQTGGPDGDLGSNEILCSKDRLLAIVDGSGVLYDPAGLNRAELVRLAQERVTVKNFSRDLLGPDGFLVTIDETNVTLPDGSTWETGARLRDVFHETDYFTADLFVPCGGRPKAVTIENCNKMLNRDTGKPKFRMVVEGANLFFTDPARVMLEQHGCHVLKDATTNKGGVTSSSLEVFSGLALNDEDHSKLMTYDPAAGETPSAFYMDYVQQILEIINENATLEFHAIWKANQESGISKVEATRQLSLEITEMQDIMSQNVGDMSAKEKDDLLQNVLPRALPRLMVEHLTVDGIIQALPENYLWAVVGAWIGSRYIYNHGIGASKVSFFFFMRELTGTSRMQLAASQIKAACEAERKRMVEEVAN